MSYIMGLADAYAMATTSKAVSTQAFGAASELTKHSGALQKYAHAALEAAVEELEKDAARIEVLTAELETERLRLAACGSAALGYFNGCRDAYKSASLDDTIRLYAKYEAHAKALELIASAENSALDLAYCKGVARAALGKDVRHD